MDVDCLMLADGAQAVGGKVYILGGGWSAIGARSFPMSHKMTVVTTLRVGWQETNERHTFKLEVQTADNETIQEIANGQFEAGRPPGIRAGDDQSMTMTVDTVLTADAPKDLQIVLSIDDTVMKRLPFRVRAAGGGASAD